MPLTPVNLTNCDLEPIHIPGKIQAHGFLIAIDIKCIIRFVSANSYQFTGQSHAALLGKSLVDVEQLFNINGIPGFLTGLLYDNVAAPVSFQNSNPFKIKINGVYLNLVISTAQEYHLLEFEPIGIPSGIDVQKMINQSIPGILEGADLASLLHYAAAQVKAIIQFDRVMIYQFAADGHGEVVAEVKNDNLVPWLGLHYPASDIPQQARELYKLNLTRLIVNVEAADAGIVTAADNESPLNLTFSQLRAVSPVHIQYLKNMGVASSYSISLLHKKELWGLIACHNYTPRFIDYELRESSKLVSQILSAALEFRQIEENQHLQSLLRKKVEMLSRQLHLKTNLEESLVRQEVTLLDVLDASGVVLVYDGRINKLGLTPGDAEIEAMIQWINEVHHEPVYYTESLCTDYPPAEPYQHIAAGLMVIPLSKDLKEYIIWFKSEIIQHIKWAGNPDKPVVVAADGMRNISPRHSFATWTKTVNGHSSPWKKEEVNAVLHLKEEILTAISTKAGAVRILNERLRHAYEELDTFSFTVSHDLKTPITAIKGYSQFLTTDATLSPHARQILERISDRADKMNFMIKAVLDHSRVGRLPIHLQLINTTELIKDISQDLKQVYGQLDPQITFGLLPALQGDPVMIWQVFSNLISNAVKYSQHAMPPAVHIEGKMSENKVFFTVKDNGIGIAEKDLDRVFLLFSRMDNVQQIEGNGIGLAIVKKIVEKHGGTIWAESELGAGSTFFLSFDLPE